MRTCCLKTYLKILKMIAVMMTVMVTLLILRNIEVEKINTETNKQLTKNKYEKELNSLIGSQSKKSPTGDSYKYNLSNQW